AKNSGVNLATCWRAIRARRTGSSSREATTCDGVWIEKVKEKVWHVLPIAAHCADGNSSGSGARERGCGGLPRGDSPQARLHRCHAQPGCTFDATQARSEATICLHCHRAIHWVPDDKLHQAVKAAARLRSWLQQPWGWTTLEQHDSAASGLVLKQRW